MPAVAWRGAGVYRAVFAGVGIGSFFGALAWLDSGIWISGLIVAVVLGTAFGIWMSRRMQKYWPGAQALSPKDRVTVVRAARGGQAVEPPLVPALAEYRQGLHAVHIDAGELTVKWVVWLILAVAAAMAAYDGLAGSVRDTVASLVYLAILAFEFFVWSRLRDRLLHNADRAAALSLE